MNKKNNIKIKRHIIYFLEKILYLLSYTIVFALMSYWFKTFVIDSEHFLMYSFVSVLIIYVLNKTIKPILVRLTLPITGLTMGLFYFFNNVIILKLVDYFMGPRVNFNSVFVLFFISILMSLLNLLIEDLIIKPFIKEVKKSE